MVKTSFSKAFTSEAFGDVLFIIHPLGNDPNLQQIKEEENISSNSAITVWFYDPDKELTEMTFMVAGNGIHKSAEEFFESLTLKEAEEFVLGFYTNMCSEVLQ